MAGLLLQAMEEAQVDTIVALTDRMLPNARNVYMVTEPLQILGITSQLREGTRDLSSTAQVIPFDFFLFFKDLWQLRRVVENARAGVRKEHRPQKPAPEPVGTATRPQTVGSKRAFCCVLRRFHLHERTHHVHAVL